MKTKCKGASRYKAMKAPTCGCDYCENMWSFRLHKNQEVRLALKRTLSRPTIISRGKPPMVEIRLADLTALRDVAYSNLLPVD